MKSNKTECLSKTSLLILILYMKFVIYLPLNEWPFGAREVKYQTEKP